MAVPEETEKKARDVNEKTALLKKKSATELGELATSINTIARDAHMEANLEMEIVPQGLRVLIKDDQNRNMFERGSAQCGVVINSGRSSCSLVEPASLVWRGVW